jgi:hypothetical protein
MVSSRVDSTVSISALGLVIQLTGMGLRSFRPEVTREEVMVAARKPLLKIPCLFVFNGLEIAFSPRSLMSRMFPDYER